MKDLSKQLEEIDNKRKGDTKGMVPSVKDMERNDAEEEMDEPVDNAEEEGKEGPMSMDKETLKCAMKEIKDEENLRYMVENKSEDELKIMEKLIAERRSALKKGDKKSDSVPTTLNKY